MMSPLRVLSYSLILLFVLVIDMLSGVHFSLIRTVVSEVLFLKGSNCMALRHLFFILDSMSVTGI